MIELGAGAGVVAAIGDVSLFITNGDAAGRLVAVAREAVAAGSSSGRTFARRLAALLTGDEADSVPDFGAVAAAGSGWVVFLYGHVDASIVRADGTEEHLSGADSATWVDRILPAATGAVLIAPAGLAPPGASPFGLEAGVVPGGWLRVGPSPPGDDDATSEMATVARGVATAPPADPKPPFEAFEAFELFSLSSDGLATRDALPIEGVTEAAAATEVDVEVEVEADVETESGVPVHGSPGRSLGLLVFDDGSTFGLDGDYVLGREPEIDDSVVEGSARPITLDDPGGTVSRVHAEVRLVDSGVQLIDRGSTNGTHLWDESSSAWDRLVPGQPRMVRPSERGAVGQRTFVYEAPLGPVGGAAPAARSAPATIAFGPVIGTLTAEGGAVYPLDRPYVIGRDPLSDDSVRQALASPIVIRDDHQVSRVHALLTLEHGTVFVRDADTPAGTFIAPPGGSSWDPVGSDLAELKPGWSLRVGTHVFTFRDRHGSI